MEEIKETIANEEDIKQIGEQEFETESIEEVTEEVKEDSDDDPNSMFPDMARMFEF